MAGEAERLFRKALAMTKAFNGDSVLLQRAKDLVEKHGIERICETGAFEAETTLALSEIIGNDGWPISVYSCELNPTNYRKSAAKTHGHSNIFLVQDNSPDFIEGTLKYNNSELRNRKWLFFLDAHWNEYNPLIDELKAIAAAGIKPVILIHDFFVPGKSTTPGAAWGFDTYGGQDYTWEWIAPHVEAIYPDGYVKSYNDDYTASRGCLILEPK